MAVRTPLSSAALESCLQNLDPLPLNGGDTGVHGKSLIRRFDLFGVSSISGILGSAIFGSAILMRAGAIVLGAAVLSGCGSSTPPEPQNEATEVAAPKGFDGDVPEDVLFQRAKQSYHNGLFSVAKDQFQGLRDNFPTGAYVDFAELKVADSMYSLHDYSQSAPAYEDYAKNHPGVLSAQYALVRAAQSYHLASRGVGRDAAQLEKARELYDRLLTQYADSIYSPEAHTDRAVVLQELSDYEEQIAAFYRKKGNMKAYEARKQALDQKWQPLVASAHREAAASERSGLALASATKNLDAGSARASLGLPAPAPVGARTMQQPIIHADSAALVEAPHESSARIQIERAECNESFAQLFLNQTLSSAELESLNAVIAEESDTHRLSIPDASAASVNLTCGDATVAIDAHGTVRIDGVSSVALFSAQNPPRLILKY